jgi:hypothetical protein
MMPQRLPSQIGVQRDKKSMALHKEVVLNLQDIARAEDKSFSRVNAEIIYAFFGLEVTDNVLKIARARRKAKTRKGRRPARR